LPGGMPDIRRRGVTAGNDQASIIFIAAEHAM
jgi:hypothetical protein